MFVDPATDTRPITRSIGKVRAAIAACAGRVAVLRDALVDYLGEVAWLPTAATLAALGPTRPTDDHDAPAPPSGVVNSILELRVEWTRLGYLLVAAGHGELSLPTALAPPPESLDYLDTMLSIRVGLLVAITAGEDPTIHDELDAQMAGSRWGGEQGTRLAKLAPQLAALWLDEHHAALAALRWARHALASPFDPV
jgi:hypothetical protein